MSKIGSPLWQIQENIKSKKLLIQSHDEDIKRYTLKRNEAMRELAEYEEAEKILAEAMTKGRIDQ